MATPYISMAGIGKSFGPVHALKSVNLTVILVKYMHY